MPGGAEPALSSVVVGERLPGRARGARRAEPFTVATARRRWAATGSRHERRGSPSTSTVHAPHPPCSQPAFGLVMPSSSRSTSSSVVSGALSTVRSTPLTVRFMRSPRASVSARRTSTGRTLPRYQAEASASSASSTSFSAASPAAAGSSALASADVKANAVPSGAGGRDPRSPRRRARGGDRERGVLVGVRALEADKRAGGRLVVRDVEEQARPSMARKSSSGSVRHPAGAGRPHHRVDRQQRRPGGRRAALSGPSPAQRLPPTVACARISRSATLPRTAPTARRARRDPHGAIGADRHRRPVARHPGEPGAGEQHAFAGCSRPCVISGMTIVPPATTVTPSPSPNGLDRLVRRGRNQDVSDCGHTSLSVDGSNPWRVNRVRVTAPSRECVSVRSRRSPAARRAGARGRCPGRWYFLARASMSCSAWSPTIVSTTRPWIAKLRYAPGEVSCQERATRGSLSRFRGFFRPSAELTMILPSRV